jgi:hypothetical protein
LPGDPDRPILLADSDARDNGENDVAEGDNAGVIVRPPLLYAAALGAMLVLRWLWPLPILGGAGLWPGLALVVLAAPEQHHVADTMQSHISIDNLQRASVAGRVR